jgi:predicted AAA+ superfamily ATPase
MLVGLPKYAGQAIRQRGSSPKLQVLNTALMTAQTALTLKEARRDGAFWGRVVESAVGAHLANAAAAGVCEVYYWRDRDREVDFVARAGQTLTAIEVKSGRARNVQAGLAAFAEAYRPKRRLLVGGDGIPLEEFLSRPVRYWVRQ